MSNQLQVSGEAKIRAIQGPVVANSGVITALDGDASEYVRGDGTLADFPTSTGGGSSVSYYLNTSVSQGTIGGVAYKQLSKVPISGAGTDVTISANGYIASYITDANDPALLEVPAGNFNCEFYFSVNSNSHNPYVYAELYKYDGTTFTLLGSNVAIPQYLTNGTTLSAYYFAIPVATSVLTVTDRISIRIYVNVDGRTVTLHTENNHLCQVVTTFSKGLISLNNLTRQNQFFQTGTSGTDFAISSSVATHTFNLPVASAANTGKLSSTDWSTFNGKVPYTGATANVDLGTNSLFAYDLFANGNGTNNANLYLKQGTASLLIQNGYSNILATGTKIGFQVATSAIAAYYADLQFSSLTAQRTFTLPDITGTLALLEGTQTFTGVKTFDEGISLKSAAFPTPATGYSSIGGNSFGITIITKQSSTIYTSNLGFPAANRTFTFPNSDGTIALTSDLSAYVTLATTQTITAQKSFSNFLIAEKGVILATGSTTFVAGSTTLNGNANGLTIGLGVTISGTTTNYAHQLLFPQLTPQTYTYPAATGTLALLSGTQTFTGATTFSSDLLVSGLTIGRGGSAVVGNTAIGAGTLAANTTGVFNTAIGYYALASNTIGVSNTAIGANSLLVNTTGNNNTAIGTDSLNVNTTGSKNTAIGYYALVSNTTASNNIAIGYYALSTNSTAAYNLAIGNNSLRNNVGTQNIGIGEEALLSNTIGQSNTAIGFQALQGNTTGGQNFALGIGALANNTTGSGNIAIGASTLASNITTSNSIGIGFNSLLFATGGNNIAIGNESGKSITTGSNNTIIGAYAGTAAMANNIVLADGAGTIRYQWNGTNNVFSNPISGTSATFSGDLTIDTNTLYVDSTNNRVGIGTVIPATPLHLLTSGLPAIRLTLGSEARVHNINGANNGRDLSVLPFRHFTVQTGNGIAEGLISMNAYEDFIVSTGSSYTTRLTIASTGAATFSSRVNVNGAPDDADIAMTVKAPSGSGKYIMFGRDASNIQTYKLTAEGAATFASSVTMGGDLALTPNDSAITFSSGAGRFFTGGVERMRITSGGQVFIGTTTALQSTEKLAIASDYNTAILAKFTGGGTSGWAGKFWNNGTTGDNLFIEFQTETSITARGSITYNRSAGLTVYNTTSDYRLKSEISDFNALNIINNLKPKEFRIGDAENKSIGFIAHELQEYLPQAVSGKKDAIDKDGNPMYQGVDYSQLTGLLVKAIQEQNQLITSLQDRLDKAGL